MLAKRIIPCLDVKNGRVVKGTQFLELRDAGDPVELASMYDQSGADEVVFLDISASQEGRSTLLEMVRRTAEQVFIPFTVGGGIRTVEDIREILKAGADKISINTAAVQRPELIAEGAQSFGSQCIVVAIDAKRVAGEERWLVVTHGGSQKTDLDVVAWAKEVERLGAGEILLTSMDADGTKDGFDYQVTAAVAEAVNIPVIASGGAGKLEHFKDAILVGKADAVLAASLFHFKELSVKEVKEYLESAGIAVRPVITNSESQNGYGAQILEEVYNVILDRKRNPKEGSYTNYLFAKGLDKILKKVGEETAETIIAAKNSDPSELVYEVGDLFYHIMVLLAEKGVKPKDVWEELASRR